MGSNRPRHQRFGTKSSTVAGADRGMTPAVSKTLEIGIVVAFTALLMTVLFGGVVPDYRSAAGAELGERVLATAAQEIEEAVPPSAETVTARRSVSLPATIAGSGYELRVEGAELVLEHPDPAVGGRASLVLPPHVDRIEGRWDSGATTVVLVEGSRDGVVVTLAEGEA